MCYGGNIGQLFHLCFLPWLHRERVGISSCLNGTYRELIQNRGKGWRLSFPPLAMGKGWISCLYWQRKNFWYKNLIFTLFFIYYDNVKTNNKNLSFYCFIVLLCVVVKGSWKTSLFLFFFSFLFSIFSSIFSWFYPCFFNTFITTNYKVRWKCWEIVKKQRNLRQKKICL